MLCAVSRGLNWLLTGRRTMICADAALFGRRRLVRALDVLFAWRDRRDHCWRCAEIEARGFGVRDGVDRRGL